MYYFAILSVFSTLVLCTAIMSLLTRIEEHQLIPSHAFSMLENYKTTVDTQITEVAPSPDMWKVLHVFIGTPQG